MHLDCNECHGYGEVFFGYDPDAGYSGSHECHACDSARFLRLYDAYVKERNSGETHEDAADGYRSYAAEFLKRYDEEQAEYSEMMKQRVRAAS